MKQLIIKLTSLIVLFFYFFAATAQNAIKFKTISSLDIGVNPETKKAKIDRILGVTENEISLLRIDWGVSPKIYIESFNNSLKRIKTNNIEIPKVDNKTVGFDNIIFHKNNFYLFPLDFKGGLKVYSQKYNKTFQPSGNPLKETELYETSFLDGGNTNYVHSPDNSKIGYFTSVSSKKDKEIIHITVINELNEVLWSTDVEFPYDKDLLTEKTVLVSNESHVIKDREVFIGNDGDALIYFKKYNSTSDKRKNDGFIYDHVIMKVSKNGIAQPPFVLPFSDMYVTGLAFSQSSSNSLFASAIYTDKTERRRAKGILTFKINSNYSAISNLQKNEVTEEQQRSFESEINYKVANPASSSIQFSNSKIIANQDSSKYFITENTYITKDKYGDEYIPVAHYLYIIITKINALGKVEWIKSIPKLQTSRINGSYGSYALIENKGNLYILYNDVKENKLTSTNPEMFTNTIAPFVTALVEVKPNGEMNRNIAFDAISDGILFIKDAIVDKQNMFILSKYKDLMKLLKITIE